MNKGNDDLQEIIDAALREMAAVCRAPGSSGSSDMERCEKYLERDHSSSWSHMTVPASRSSDATDGNTCTTRNLRFISPMVRSCRLLVHRRFQ